MTRTLDAVDQDVMGLRGQFNNLNRSVTTYGLTRPWNTPWGFVGYATATSNQTGITTVTNVTSLSVTFTAVANRLYKTTVYLPFASQNTAAATVQVLITDGSNTQKQSSADKFNASDFHSLSVVMVETISAGSVTRKARASASAGTLDINSSSTAPSLICVEDLGPTAAQS